jgi:hypothetical protein
MQLLIIDDSGNIKLFINTDKIGHIEFTPNAAVLYFAPGHEIWDGAARLFIIGSSRVKLENALRDDAIRCNLRESELLTGEQFQQWNQRSQPVEPIGALAGVC